MEPKLSILICTIGRRNDQFLKLIDSLRFQIGRKPIEIVGYWNSGEKSIGEFRQALLEEARGKYICFVDDDDTVPLYYCKEILKALGKDYVGFEVDLFEDGMRMPKVVHSLKYGTWHQDDQGYYRGITHLNPVKRELALQGSFSTQGIGEDAAWAGTLRDIVLTENYIDKVMYNYHHSREFTTFGGTHQPPKQYKRPVVEYAKFRWHPNSNTKGIL